jgi:transposase
MLTVIWQMAQTGELYHDPGPDYHALRDPTRAQRRAVAQLEALGYHVTLARTA